ncbi:MAG: AMP-binding protein, partial [Gammaproteobacteria bacterium]
LIRDARPMAAIVSESLREKLSKINAVPVFNLFAVALAEADEVLRSSSLKERENRENDPDIAVILYTSGTTGKFKGVILTHKNLLFTVQAARTLMGANNQDSILCLLPVYHVFGLIAALLTPLAVGAKITFVEKLQSDVILRTMQMSGCTILPAVPRLLDLFSAGIERQVAAKPLHTQVIFRMLSTVTGIFRSWLDYNLGIRVFKPVHASFGGKLRMIVSGGASLDKNIFYQLESLGFTVVEGYGLTEASSLVSVNTPRHRVMGSVGMPVPGTQIELFNTNAMGEGEIIIKGPHVMRGYFRDPESTKLAMQNGWFHTGDLGKFDVKGNLIITGRIKELIVKPNGEKAMPEDVERRYRGIAGVTELAVVGMPAKEGYGEEIHAALILAQGNTEQDIKNRILERSLQVPSTLRIQECHFLTTLPKTSTLKVKRKKLMQQLLDKNKIPTLKKESDTEGGWGIFERWRKDPIIKSVHDIILNMVSPSTRERLTHIKPEFSLQFDLGLDSLSRMELAQAIQQKFSIHFEEKQLVVLYTVGDLIQAVKNAKPGEADFTFS